MTKQKAGAKLSTADTAPKFSLGETHEDKYGTVYQYILANGAVTVNQVISVPDGFDCTPLTTTISGAKPQGVGIAQATLADNEYGWAAIGPIATDSGVTVSALANCAADVLCYTTATAGSIDDAATDVISGLALSTANGGSTADVACYSATRLAVNS